MLHLCEYFDLLLNCTREGDRPDSSPEKVRLAAFFRFPDDVFHQRSIDAIDPKPVDEQTMEELNKKYLDTERNWYFQEKFFKDKLIESSVWPAKLLHQYQVVTKEPYTNLIVPLVISRQMTRRFERLIFNGRYPPVSSRWNNHVLEARVHRMHMSQLQVKHPDAEYTTIVQSFTPVRSATISTDVDVFVPFIHTDRRTKQ